MDNLHSTNSIINNRKYKIITKFLNKEPWMKERKMSSKTNLLKSPKQNFLPKTQKGNNQHRLHIHSFPIKQNKIQSDENNNLTIQKEKSKESFVDLVSEFFSCPHLGMNSSKIEKNVTKNSDNQSYKKFLPKIASTPVIKPKTSSGIVPVNIIQTEKLCNEPKIIPRNEHLFDKFIENSINHRDKFNYCTQIPKSKKIVESNFKTSNFHVTNNNFHLIHNDNGFLLKNNINTMTESFHSAPDLMNTNILNKVEDPKQNFLLFENYKNQLQSSMMFKDSNFEISTNFNDKVLFDNEGINKTKSFFDEGNQAQDDENFSATRYINSFNFSNNEDSFMFDSHRQKFKQFLHHQTISLSSSESTKMCNEESQKTRHKSRLFNNKPKNLCYNNPKDHHNKFILPSCWSHNEKFCRKDCLIPSQNKAEIIISLKNKSQKLNIRYPKKNRNKVRLQAEFEC